MLSDLRSQLLDAGVKPLQVRIERRKAKMKIYHLIIAYNDKTEEIEYIQEEIEEAGGTSSPVEIDLDLDEKYFDDELLMRLIHDVGLGEA